MAGVWKPDFALANFSLGIEIDWKAQQTVMADRLLILQNGDWLLTKFVEFQYHELAWRVPPHRTILKILQKHFRNGYPRELARIIDHGPFPLVLPDPEPEPIEPAKVKALPVRRTVPKIGGKGTLEEVLAFCKETGIEAEDGEWFFYKCEGSGWTNNGRPITDWKNTLRSWRMSHILPSQKKKAADEKARTQARSPGGAARTPSLNTAADYGKRPAKA